MTARLGRLLGSDGACVTLVDHQAKNPWPTDCECAHRSCRPSGFVNCVVVLPPTEPVEGGIITQLLSRTERAERGERTRLIETVLDAVAEVDECRLLVFGDADEAPFDFAEVKRDATELAHGLGYEIEVNGTEVESIRCLVIGDPEPETAETLESVLAWSRA